MQVREAVIRWSADGEIAVMPVGCVARSDLRNSGGACHAAWRTMPNGKEREVLLQEFWRLVLLHGLDPKAVDQAFMVIDEYKWNFGDEVVWTV